MNYLDRFFNKLEKNWQGSLFSVSQASHSEKNAKKFLSLLAQKQRVQRVTWGWYWIPHQYRDFFDFLKRDKHFKVLQKQTAASIWNGDFIHRDYFSVAVENESYRRALEEFSKKYGWNVVAETRTFSEEDYQKVGGLNVETLEETIVDCLKEWAFSDAFSALYENAERIHWEKLEEHYWERIPGTNIRIGQVLRNGSSMMGQYSEKFAPSRARVSDQFVARQIEEAVQRVGELG